MTDSFGKHIISSQINIEGRFRHKPNIVDRLLTVSKEFENDVWKKLKDNNFFVEYELLSNNFQYFEAIEFSKDYEAVSRYLRSFDDMKRDVLLTWACGTINPIVTDTATFVYNWEEFYYPSSDDLIVISDCWKWIAYFSHYECFYFGKDIKIP